MHSFRTPSQTPALATLALLGFVALPVHAGTDITGTYTGAAGASVSGSGSDTGGVLFGNFGDFALLPPNGSYTVHDTTMTGGRGGTATGTAGAIDVYGGSGGNGLECGYFATMTINSGTFTGGAGGTTGGTAAGGLNGGSGGDGFFIDQGTAVINGGTFRGGTSGTPSGSAPTYGGGGSGSGINANSESLTTIYGGSFFGGNVPSTPANPGGTSRDGVPVAGLDVEAGTVNVYGGTFTAGKYDSGALPGSNNFYTYDLFVGGGSSRLTLYGSNFTVNGVANFSGVVPAGSGTITGRLQNNGGFTTMTYYVAHPFSGGDGLLTIVAAPEPSQCAGLALGTLGLAGLAMRARKRNPSA